MQTLLLQVFYAPHIANMSSALGTRFQPIRYTLTPTGELVSNVRYSAPLMGTGWLSASGGAAGLSVQVHLLPARSSDAALSTTNVLFALDVQPRTSCTHHPAKP